MKHYSIKTDIRYYLLSDRPIGLVVECLPMAQETRVQSQVESYQRLKKWYLIPPCLTLNIIRYISRVKWSNPGKEVAPSLTPQCSSYWKGSFQVALDYSHQLYYLLSNSIALKLCKWYSVKSILILIIIFFFQRLEGIMRIVDYISLMIMFIFRQVCWLALIASLVITWVLRWLLIFIC